MRPNQTLYDQGFIGLKGANGLEGWFWKGLPSHLVSLLSGNLKPLLGDSTSRVLKAGARTTIIKSEWREGGGRSWRLIIKRFRERSFPLGLEMLRPRSLALQNLEAALLLGRNGIATAPPLAAVEQRKGTRLKRSYYVSEEIIDGVILRNVWKDLLARRAGEGSLKKKRTLLKALGALIAKMHGLNLYHPDLKESNILVRPSAGGSNEFVLVDLDRVRAERKLPWQKRIKNLVQICRTRWLTERDKLAFLRSYADELQLSRHERSLVKRRVAVAWRSFKGKRQLHPGKR